MANVLALSVLLGAATAIEEQHTEPNYSSPIYDYRLAERFFVLDTRNWNHDKSGLLTCTLNVKKSSPNVCRLGFNFNSFGRSIRLDCKSEYLTIGQEKICGDLSGRHQFPFSGGALTLSYRGKSPLTMDVEQINCGDADDGGCDVTSREFQTEITSPNYPREYPPSSYCQYTILPVNEEICQVSILFEDFDIKDSPNCIKDRLMIGSERFCGNLRGRRINRNIDKSLIIRFVSDSAVAGRGFRARLRQIECGNTLYPRNAFHQNLRECCRREYREPYMILTSPGFLDNRWIESDCVYTIHPSGPKACSLRFVFRNFWLGDEDVFYGCVNGFLEIDGKRFCGCLDGYQYVTNFDADKRKVLRYMNVVTGNRGFVIEVFEDGCETNTTETDPNTEIEIFHPNVTWEKSVSRFILPRDSSRCRQWNSPGWSDRVSRYLNSASVPTSCPPSQTKRGFEDVPLSQFYPFPDEDSDFFPPNYPPEPVFPFPPPPPSFEGHNYAPYPSLLPPPVGDIYHVRGHIQSPGFSNGYPPNLRLEYKFLKMFGYCKLRFYFYVFDVERSFKCWKDYLLMDNRRHCGRFFGKAVYVPFPRSGLISVKFVSDKCFNGRGFFAEYRQILCQPQFAYLQSESRAMERLEGKADDGTAERSGDH